MPETYEMVEKERDALRIENRYKLRPEIESLTAENKRLKAALEKMKLSLEPWQEERGTPEDRFLWKLRGWVTEALNPANQKEANK